MPCGRRQAVRGAVLTVLRGAALAVWGAAGLAQGSAGPTGGVLSVGGAVTESIYALGAENSLVARDTTSTYPPEAETLPDVGYMRALSPEGVLSVAPALVIAEDGAGPPETIEVLRSAGIPVVTVPLATDADGIAEKIRIVGEALGVPGRAGRLAADVEARVAAARGRAETAAGGTRKRVLFILSTQGGRILASGTGTAADAIIGLAGGVNAARGFEGYKPMSDEAVSQAAPDVILMMDRGGDHAITNELLFAMPALQPTPAAETAAILRMNGLYLLGFGPRTAEAVAELNARLYGR